uniref:Uncharacterized protein n=1 Tax=Romanomermis culicivorax TaxID=13658 RepID=A0A915IG67_ROMCU
MRRTAPSIHAFYLLGSIEIANRNKNSKNTTKIMRLDEISDQRLAEKSQDEKRYVPVSIIGQIQTLESEMKITKLRIEILGRSCRKTAIWINNFPTDSFP